LYPAAQKPLALVLKKIKSKKYGYAFPQNY